MPGMQVSAAEKQLATLRPGGRRNRRYQVFYIVVAGMAAPHDEVVFKPTDEGGEDIDEIR